MNKDRDCSNIVGFKEAMMKSDNMNFWMDLDDRLDGDFPSAVKTLMSATKVTQGELAERLGIDNKTAYRLIHLKCPSVEQIVAVCIALKAPSLLFFRLARLAGRTLTYSRHNEMFRMMISQDDMTIDKANEMLRKAGFRPLTGDGSVNDIFDSYKVIPFSGTATF